MNFRPPTDGRWAMEPPTLVVGDTVTLDDGHQWTVKAVTEHFTAVTRPVTDADRKEHRDEYDEAHWDTDLDGDCYDDLDGDVFYSVLDWANGYRGPCNLIGRSYGSGDYTEAECADMLAEFEAGELEISHRNWTRINFADEAGQRR